MKIIKDVSEMQAFSNGERAKGKRIVLVPTMGYLHEGHKTLLNTGRQKGEVLVLSIFVNPAQFGPKEDFKSYPRNLEGDLKAAEDCGVDAVFMPSPEGMYPEGYQTYVNVEDLPEHLCGLSRPGHFRGVATVVLKLFNIVKPHIAVFGKKDFQQLLVLKRMVRDLNLDIEIIGAETVRESDGLAMSSRNSYLSPEERKAAKVIPFSMDEAKRDVSAGGYEASAIIEKVKKTIEKEPLAVIDYIRVCDKESLEDLDKIEDSALLAVAVKIGKARLIDNCVLSKTQ